MAPLALIILALPHCIGLSYWLYQLVLSWYLHEPESTQLSFSKVSDIRTDGHPDPKIGPQVYLGSDKNEFGVQHEEMSLWWICLSHMINIVPWPWPCPCQFGYTEEIVWRHTCPQHSFWAVHWANQDLQWKAKEVARNLFGGDVR